MSYTRPDGIPANYECFPALSPKFVQSSFAAQLAEMRLTPARLWSDEQRVLCTFLFIGLTKYLLDERAVAMAYLRAACALPREIIIDLQYTAPLDREFVSVLNELFYVVNHSKFCDNGEQRRNDESRITMSENSFKSISYNGFPLTCSNLEVSAAICRYLENQRAYRPGPLFTSLKKQTKETITTPGITRVFRPVWSVLDLPRVQFARLNRDLCDEFRVCMIKGGAAVPLN